jgi:hypothetical protein
MKMVPFTNNKDHVMHIGNKSISPGDTREVDATLHPDYKPAPAAQPEPVDKIADLQALPLKELKPQLTELDDTDLAALDVMEQSQKKPRSSLISLIAEIQLNRAQDDDAIASSDMERFAQQLETHDDAMLDELAKLHADDEQHLALITAEQERRAQAE